MQFLWSDNEMDYGNEGSFHCLMLYKSILDACYMKWPFWMVHMIYLNTSKCLLEYIYILSEYITSTIWLEYHACIPGDPHYITFM